MRKCYCDRQRHYFCNIPRPDGAGWRIGIPSLLPMLAVSFLAYALPLAAQVVHTQPNVVLTRNAAVAQLVRQPDGKLLATGTVTQSGGLPVNSDIVRIDPATGALDRSFAVRLDNGSFRILTFGNHVYLLGQFTQVNGVARNQLARVSIVDGSLDANWNPNPQPLVSNQIAIGDIAIDPSGNLYTFGSLYNIGGKSNVRVAKIPASSSTGQADPNFDGAAVYPVSPSQDIVASRILWSPAKGGSLFVFGRTVVQTPDKNQRVYRLHPTTGTPDPTWSPDLTAIDMLTLDVAADSAGDLYIAGQAVGTATAQFSPAVFASPYSLAKISGIDGQVPSNWNGPTRGPASPTPADRSHVAIDFDGQGNVYTVRGFFLSDTFSPRVAKFNAATGAPVSSFTGVTANGGSLLGSALAVAPDGVFYGGDFSYYGTARAGPIVKLDLATGAPIAGFQPHLKTTPQVSASTRLTDGRIVIGGSFTEVDGLPVNNLLRLNTDGSVDTSFTSGPNGMVVALKAVNGRLYVGGFFSHVGQTAQPFIARFNLISGAFDAAWNPAVDGTVRGIAGGNNGSIYLQGGISTVNGVPTRCLAKLSEANGTPDANFQPAMTGGGFGNFCSRALLLVGNSIYSGLPNTANNGSPTRYLVNGNQRTLAKIDATTGIVDNNFDPNPRNAPNATNTLAGLPVAALDFDGTNLWVQLGGAALGSTVGNVNTRLAKMNPANGAVDPNFANLLSVNNVFLGPVAIRATSAGVYVAGNLFSGNNAFLNMFARRILPNGTLDPVWNPNLTPEGTGFNAAIEPFGNGPVAIGGTFVDVNGSRRVGVAVLSGANPIPLTVQLAGGKAELTVRNSNGQPQYLSCSVCVPGTYSEDFEPGSQITVEVRPLPGWTFSGWSGGTGNASCTGARACQFTLNTASSITATLTPRAGVWFDE